MTPTLYDELNRKTSEALQMMLVLRQQERIRDSELVYAVKALWHATSGLVDEDVARTMEALSQETADVKDTIIYSKDDAVVLFVVNRSTLKAIAVNALKGTVVTTIEQDITQPNANEAFRQRLDFADVALVESGFSKIY